MIGPSGCGKSNIEKRPRYLRHDRDEIISVAFDPEGKILAASGSDIRLWSVADGKRLGTLSGHLRRVFSTAFDPSGRVLMSAASRAQLRERSTRALPTVPADQAMASFA